MVQQDVRQPHVGVGRLQSEFVPVVFASNLAEARQYKGLLESHGIPVLLHGGRGEDKIYSVFAQAVPVLVPDHLHDRASNLVLGVEQSGAARLRCGDEDEDEDADDDFEEDDDEFDDDFDDDFDEDEEDSDE